MINKKLKEVIKIISAKLKGKKIRWVLVGSVSLALQGVKIKPKDIDILTDKEGAFQIEKLFEKHKIQVFPVKLSHSKLFKSYFGKFKIKGVKFEVMGDLKEKVGNKWVSFSARLKSPKIVKLEGIKVPVSSLEEQLKSYSRLRRKKDFVRIKQIKKVLEK